MVNVKKTEPLSVLH